MHRWQAAKCPGAICVRAGLLLAQASVAYLHRVWKQQPAGGFRGLGTSPPRVPDILVTSGSGMGMASNRAWV